MCYLPSIYLPNRPPSARGDVTRAHQGRATIKHQLVENDKAQYMKPPHFGDWIPWALFTQQQLHIFLHFLLEPHLWVLDRAPSVSEYEISGFPPFGAGQEGDRGGNLIF